MRLTFIPEIQRWAFVRGPRVVSTFRFRADALVYASERGLQVRPDGQAVRWVRVTH